MVGVRRAGPEEAGSGQRVASARTEEAGADAGQTVASGDQPAVAAAGKSSDEYRYGSRGGWTGAARRDGAEVEIRHAAAAYVANCCLAPTLGERGV